MTFNIFDSPTKEGIDVGYISSDRGYVTNVTICEANEYAKSNPGTVFIIKNRDFVKYLDINEVNNLDPQDLIPEGADECAGYDEDVEVDANGELVEVNKGGVQLEYNPRPCKTSVHFYGGGGVGVQANPIVGTDGAVLAVDVIRGGFGYQYPPLVDIKDTCGMGIGAKGKAFIDKQKVITFKYYDDGLTEEEYKTCDDTAPSFGRRYDAQGKDIGVWDPDLYRREAEKTPYQRAVDEYNKALKEYTKPWMSGRTVTPSLIFWDTSNRSSKEKYDVTHENWSDFMNKYAMSPVPESNVPGSDFGKETFTLEWDIDFPTEGEYTFRGLYDGAEKYGDFYIDNEKIGTFKKSNQKPEQIKKIYKKGGHTLRFNLKNNIFKKPAAIQPNISNIIRGSSTTEVISDPSLNSNQTDVSITGLKIPGDRRWASPQKLEFDDDSGNGFDVNAYFEITSVVGGTAVFNKSGKTIDFVGDSVTVTLKYKWNDRPSTSGKCLETIQIGNTIWTQGNVKRGEEIHTVTLQKIIKTRTVTTPTTADVSYGSDVPASSIEIRSFFNTKDWIDKANRKLWKTPSGGFLGVYGVTPFDPAGVGAIEGAHAGIHRIIWNNITFPISANYKIEVQVDDNVRLKIGDQVDIQKDGFAVRGDSRTATGKSTYTVYIEKGSYEVIADLEQIEGGTYGFSKANAMALGINIEAEIATEEVFDDTKSWNENPLGLALSIESPLPLPPTQSIPGTKEGECPPNPIWHTRLPGSTERWSPVIGFPFWSKFLNQYALSPVPPLSTFGTDGTGVVYKNTWTVDLPYAGEYKLRGAVDNWGRILIDGIPYQRFTNEEISSIPSEGSVNRTLAGPVQNTQPIVGVNLTEGQHEITVEVENWKNYESPRSFVEKKIFSTKDWQSSDSSRKRTYADVTFKTTTASAYGNSITIAGIFSEAKVLGDPDIKVTNTYSVEKGRVYDVSFTSDSTGSAVEGLQYIGLNAANNPIEVTNNGKRLCLKDGDGNDCNASFTIDSGDVKFSADGKSLVGTGSVKFTLSWNDRPRSAGVAVQKIRIGTTTWTQSGRSGSETHTVQIGGSNSAFGTSNNSNIKLRNNGDNVVQMEDLPDAISDWDWQDMMCTASEGKFYGFNGNKCKYVIGDDVTTTSTRNGVVYTGPKLYNYKHSGYGAFIRDSGVSPDYPKIGGMGEVVSYEWSNVEFDADGEYEFHFANDAHGSLYLDGTEIIKGSFDNLVGVSALDASNWTAGIRKKIQVNKGKHTISTRATNINSGAHAGNVDGLFTKLSSDYYRGQQAWDNNPSAFAVNVSRKVETFPEAGSNDERLGKSWQANPMAISAVLIPAPCRQDVSGDGVVTRVEVTDTGNGYPIPTGTPDPGDYDVTLRLVDIVITGTGIGYTDGTGTVTVDPPPFIPPEKPPGTPPPVGIPTTSDGPGISTGPRIIIDPPNGAEFEPNFDGFGRVVGVTTIKPGIGFTQFPRLDYPTDTGINLKMTPVFEIVRDPVYLNLEPNQLIQVTDLVGIKQTGYYKGRPYYGAVFYKNGAKYAGNFETAGELIRVYDTLQESISAKVTTPPSAILRQGTDTNSNNPQLNIPDTPENLI